MLLSLHTIFLFLRYSTGSGLLFTAQAISDFDPGDFRIWESGNLGSFGADPDGPRFYCWLVRIVSSCRNLSRQTVLD